MGRKGRPKEDPEVATIAAMFGELGCEGIQIGSTTIPTTKPEALPELRGYGDVLKPGDHFRCDFLEAGKPPHVDPTVYRLELVFEASNGYLAIHAHQVREQVLPNLTIGPTSMNVSGKGWRRHFHLVPPP